jgi:hypothetical protein
MRRDPWVPPPDHKKLCFHLSTQNLPRSVFELPFELLSFLKKVRYAPPGGLGALTNWTDFRQDGAPSGPHFPKGIGGFGHPIFNFFPLAGRLEKSVTQLFLAKRAVLSTHFAKLKKGGPKAPLEKRAGVSRCAAWYACRLRKY